MRILWCTLVLRMELGADKERMDRLRKFHYLRKTRLRVMARCNQARLLEVIGILGVELVAVTVTLGYKFAAVDLVCQSILCYLAIISTQSHRATLHGSLLLILHHIYHRMLGIGVDLG